jgi:formylglycine-generating enzyme required for sulfatase activity
MNNLWIEPITGTELVYVPKGCFMMGSDSQHKNEKPLHMVCLDGFWIGKYPVTQKQYKKMIGINPAPFKKESCPVENVSWGKAKEFVEKLNQQTGKIFSLPTEAQWEYVARSGGQERHEGDYNIDEVAWYSSNSVGSYMPHPVGEKASNDLGAYDMYGNVWEWCEDVYDENAYEKHEKKNPLITSGSVWHVLKGGSYLHPKKSLFGRIGRYHGDIGIGFRLCLSEIK